MAEPKQIAHKNAKVIIWLSGLWSVFSWCWAIFDRLVSLASGALVNDTSSAIQNALNWYSAMSFSGTDGFQNALVAMAVLTGLAMVVVIVLDRFFWAVPAAAAGAKPRGGRAKQPPPKAPWMGIAGASAVVAFGVFSAVVVYSFSPVTARAATAAPKVRPTPALLNGMSEVSAEEWNQREIVKRSVVLPSLFTERWKNEPNLEFVVRDKLFVGCTIYGPAVVLLARTDIDESNLIQIPRLEGPRGRFSDADSVLVGFDTLPQKGLNGGIHLNDCVFKNCHFIGVTIAGTPEQIGTLRQTARLRIGGQD